MPNSADLSKNSTHWILRVPVYTYFDAPARKVVGTIMHWSAFLCDKRLCTPGAAVGCTDDYGSVIKIRLE
jgi:hypothetical protein